MLHQFSGASHSQVCIDPNISDNIPSTHINQVHSIHPKVTRVAYHTTLVDSNQNHLFSFSYTFMCKCSEYYHLD